MRQVARSVGRFEIEREIGRGGMAVVYLARQTDLDRMVALKELPSFHAGDPAFANRFLRESRIAGSLTHPNIVTVHDYFEHDGTPFIAMEYMARGSLRPYVGKLNVAQIAGVLEGLLAALAYAQTRGVVHRDLKPENLMLSTEGAIKVADFGIAKAVNEVATKFATATGTTVGTPAYMSPEQAMGKPVGPPTDLYATGIIAYELLLGRTPFHDIETPVAILLKHVSEPPPPCREIDPNIDADLAAWVERMLAKNPEERPAGAAEAWDDLEEIVIGLLGPRWRRDARVLGPEASQAADKPLTPAPFFEPEGSGEFAATMLPGGQPAPTPLPTVPAVSPPPAAAAAPVTPPAEAPPQAGQPDDGFATFARGAQPAAAAPPPAPPTAPPPTAPAPEGFETFVRSPGDAAADGSALAPAAPPPPADPVAQPTDGFKTFVRPDAMPPPPPAPPPPPPPPVVEAPPPEPEPEPTVAPDALAETVAPETPPSRTAEYATAPTDAVQRPRSRKRGLIIGGVAAAVVAALVVVVISVAGGGGGGKAATPAAGTPSTPDVIPERRVDMIGAGTAVIAADPAGHVMRLSSDVAAGRHGDRSHRTGLRRPRRRPGRRRQLRGPHLLPCEDARTGRRGRARRRLPGGLGRRADRRDHQRAGRSASLPRHARHGRTVFPARSGAHRPRGRRLRHRGRRRGRREHPAVLVRIGPPSGGNTDLRGRQAARPDRHAQRPHLHSDRPRHCDRGPVEGHAGRDDQDRDHPGRHRNRARDRTALRGAAGQWRRGGGRHGRAGRSR